MDRVIWPRIFATTEIAGNGMGSDFCAGSIWHIGSSKSDSRLDVTSAPAARAAAWRKDSDHVVPAGS